MYIWKVVPSHKAKEATEKKMVAAAVDVGWDHQGMGTSQRWSDCPELSSVSNSSHAFETKMVSFFSTVCLLECGAVISLEQLHRDLHTPPAGDTDAAMEADVFDAIQSSPNAPPVSPSDTDSSDDDNWRRELVLNLFAEEATLTRDRAEDVALDMDIDESHFIFDDALQDDLEEGGFDGVDVDRFDESYDEY
ncbi:hypothetical protein BDZ89DRAFT_1133380 [Hymenopellis radicata]|nr:hypothetical protein BDZ89DRAFT_1133380 [Hymenopellis radicata]